MGSVFVLTTHFLLQSVTSRKTSKEWCGKWVNPEWFMNTPEAGATPKHETDLFLLFTLGCRLNFPPADLTLEYVSPVNVWKVTNCIQSLLIPSKSCSHRTWRLNSKWQEGMLQRRIVFGYSTWHDWLIDLLERIH